MYGQAVYQWRPGGSPRLARVLAVVDDSVRVAGTLVAAVGGTPVQRGSEVTSQDFRTRTDSLYRVMRNALSRGDWVAFGRAFDGLGAALRGSTP
jgi:hypothetical protein